MHYKIKTMVNFKSINKNTLLEIANKLNLSFENEVPVKKDIIFSISKYCEEKELSEEEINKLIDLSKEKEETVYVKNTEVEKKIEEDVEKKKDNSGELLKTNKEQLIERKSTSNRLSYKEKQWLKFLEDRKITAKGFLQLRPNFTQKEIIYKLQLLGY